MVLDPLDGTTNASRGLPWYATSLCAVDGDGPRAALVVDQASGARFEARRGAAARRSTARPCVRRAAPCCGDAIVGLSGYPPRWLGWKQFRALGAVALDLCAVAGRPLDAYVDCSAERPRRRGTTSAGLLVCQEAGAVVVDAAGRDLVVLDHAARRTPVAGGDARAARGAAGGRAVGCPPGASRRGTCGRRAVGRRARR